MNIQARIARLWGALACCLQRRCGPVNKYVRGPGQAMRLPPDATEQQVHVCRQVESMDASIPAAGPLE
jgi:hypothetical protein